MKNVQVTIWERHLLASGSKRFNQIEETNTISVFYVKEEVDCRQPTTVYI